ncbi:hypothetical protein [Pseudomonas chlororaphis]|uniref:hypothetical protein n=1 Tax=Pseudomonas chlororaphis TaxID=587753 RepID=UPI001473D9A1|nr:hypothetical protein [Pseudomonas chlororaphis]NNB42247.1 hypothetical protein [Pseudomonas chlororaphis]
MQISLEKIIDPSSLRGIGGIQRGVEPHKLVSAGHRAHLIAEALGGKAFTVGRTRPRNAFCVQAANAYYLFAHRDYQGYRSFFRRFFHAVPVGCDIDHVLSKGLAARIGVPFLLLAAVPKSANRSHASAERCGIAPSRQLYLGKTFPLDERMFHKVMGRRVNKRQSAAVVRSGYVLGNNHAFGLTLKQRGAWNLAFCIDVIDAGLAPRSILRPI